jgi:hypothetical protein
MLALSACKYFQYAVCGLAGKGTELLTSKLEKEWSSETQKCNKEKLYDYLYPDILNSLCKEKTYTDAKGAVSKVCEEVVKTYAKHKAKKVALKTECDEKEVREFFENGQAVCPFIEAAVAAIAAGA